MSSSGGSRGRRQVEEEHENHERWLVTYADMVTLLMVLFIVMFAMSQVDERKFMELKDGLAAGFGASDGVLNGSDNLLDQPGVSAVDAPAPQAQFAGTDELPGDAAVQRAVEEVERQREQRRWAEARAEADRLDGLAKRIRGALRRRGLEDDVTTRLDERGLVLSLVSRHVTFRAHLASLSPRGERAVDALAPVLRDLPDPLQIDGHTNQVQVQPKYYETDWDLSAARAVTVLRRLQERWGIPADRLTASAFGGEKPLRDPGAPGSQAVNKRVDIVVVSSLPSRSRDLLEALAPRRGESTTRTVSRTNDVTEPGRDARAVPELMGELR